jgi:hypothetical protein
MLSLFGDLDESTAEFAAQPYDVAPKISVFDFSALYKTTAGCQFRNAPNCALDLMDGTLFVKTLSR